MASSDPSPAASARSSGEGSAVPARVTALRQPPIVGRWYLVPTVEYEWLWDDDRRAWPVFLPKHEDAEHLNFPHQHYHVDPRFIGARLWQRTITAGQHYDGAGRHDGLAFAFAQRYPLSRRGGSGQLKHGPVIWRRLRCARSVVPYTMGHQTPIIGLRAAFAGQQCATSRGGWLCPHKRFPLGSIAPGADGVITCPLHGLRIRAADGVALPAQPQDQQSAGDKSREDQKP